MWVTSWMTVAVTGPAVADDLLFVLDDVTETTTTTTTTMRTTATAAHAQRPNPRPPGRPAGRRAAGGRRPGPLGEGLGPDRLAGAAPAPDGERCPERWGPFCGRWGWRCALRPPPADRAASLPLTLRLCWRLRSLSALERRGGPVDVSAMGVGVLGALGCWSRRWTRIQRPLSGATQVIAVTAGAS